jgi:hypothetical protein
MQKSSPTAFTKIVLGNYTKNSDPEKIATHIRRLKVRAALVFLEIMQQIQKLRPRTADLLKCTMTCCLSSFAMEA